VSFGGQAATDSSTFISDYDSDSNVLVDMSVIMVYDVASDKFYSQKATGDVPPSRWGLCAVSVELSNGETDMCVQGCCRLHMIVSVCMLTFVPASSSVVVRGELLIQQKESTSYHFLPSSGRYYKPRLKARDGRRRATS